MVCAPRTAGSPRLAPHRPLGVAAAALAAALAAAASAQVTGLSGEAWKGTYDGTLYRVLDVYIDTVDPEDRVLLVWNSQVILSGAAPGTTFFNVALSDQFESGFPVCPNPEPEAWPADSYFCLGGEQCDTAGIQWRTPDLPFDFLVDTSATSSSGGWFNVPPNCEPNAAGPDRRVRVLRLAIRDDQWAPGTFVTVGWRIAWETCDYDCLHTADFAAMLDFPADPGVGPSIDLLGNADSGCDWSGSQPPVGAFANDDVLWKAPGGYFAGWRLEGLLLDDTVSQPAPLPPGYQSLRSVDLDADGDRDLVFRHVTSSTLLIYEMQNGVKIAEHFLDGPGPGTWAVLGIGDTNGDGTAEVVWRKTDAGNQPVRVWILDDMAKIADGQVGLSPGFEFMAFTDVNGDGRHDLTWRIPTGQLLTWKLNGILAPVAQMLGNAPAMPSNWKIVAAPDLDGDGDTDFLWHNLANGKVNAWMIQGGARQSGGTVINFVPPAWKVTHVADLDADGDDDILWRSPGTGQVNGWLMQGMVRLSGSPLGFPGPGWQPLP